MSQRYFVGIAIVGYFDIMDNHLGEAFMLMSQNLSEAKWSLMDLHKITLSGTHYPLKYDFSERPLTFRTHGNVLPQLIRDELLVHCQGVIVSLAGRALDVKFLESDEDYSALLKKLAETVYETKLPTVFTIEDVKDRFEPIYIPVPAERGGFSRKKMSPSVIATDDIWQSDSTTIHTIRSILKIPQAIPILPYTYHQPASIQNILTTLLEEINRLSTDRPS